MSTLETLFVDAANQKSDINEHIFTLYEYTKFCESVLELGVRDCVSSWAFLKGLMDNNKETKRLICNDLKKSRQIDRLLDISKEVGCDTVFFAENDLDLDLGGENVDLCFIDTWHVYGQLKRELEKFAPITRKYIVMHDTEVDRVYGESLRCGLNIVSQAKISGFPEDEIKQGLGRAISEFLELHPEWSIELEKKNNNGLTVLKRKDIKKKKEQHIHIL